MGTTVNSVSSMRAVPSNECKLSMLLNWNTINTCFLSSSIHIHSHTTFTLLCLASFMLVISVEGLRRLQRELDHWLRSRRSSTDEEFSSQNYNLLEGGKNKWMSRKRVVIEQVLRGFVHGIQFMISYVIMLLFMYSNGYVMISLVLGAMVGFALFTADALSMKQDVRVRRELYSQSEGTSSFDDRGKTAC